MRNTVFVGDAVDRLRTLPDESVHCCVTSPPYWGLRDYGTARWEGGDPSCPHSSQMRAGSGRADGVVDSRGQRNRDGLAGLHKMMVCTCGAKRIDDQLGLEPTPELYVQRIVEVFHEVRRVLHPSGTLWLNLGDSYAGGGGFSPNSPSNIAGSKQTTQRGAIAGNIRPQGDLKPKDLVGIPWMVAFALRADGWYLRSDVIWAKNSCMPESVTDRPTRSHEYVFLLTKNPRYFYDQEAIRETAATADPDDPSYRQNGKSNARRKPVDAPPNMTEQSGLMNDPWRTHATRNKRSVWHINPKPYPEAHFATFPPELPKLCILAGTSEHGVCPHCNAPWERVVEALGGRDDNGVKSGIAPENHAGGRRTKAPSGSGGGNMLSSVPRSISGWKPSCTCPDNDPVPAVVLDPFAGSGTTLAVAKELRRDFVGIELNPEYRKLIDKRVQPMLDLEHGRAVFDALSDLEDQ